MMTCETCRAMLDDFVDGELAVDTCRKVECHLSSCEACRDAATDLVQLVDAARHLSRSLAPPDGVWREIEKNLRAEKVKPVGLLTLPRWAYGTAAAVMVACGILLAWSIQSREMARGPRQAVQARSSEGIRTDFARAKSELYAVLTAQEGRLDPQTVAVIETNMAIVDKAMAEIEAAMKDDPGNPELSRLLLATYREQMGLLGHATQLAVSE